MPIKQLLLSAILYLIFVPSSKCQDITQIIDSVKVDSLVKYVNELTGEDTITIWGYKTVMYNRVNPGNDLAAAYLIEKLKKYDVAITDNRYSSTGRNILAYQKGTTDSDSCFIVSAHYDAVITHCADDNASGTATVLEAVRILSQYQFKYDIIYIFWDEEEIGMVGSLNFTEHYNKDTIKIIGAITLDMIGYNTSSNMVFTIQNNRSFSQVIKDRIVSFSDNYLPSLTPYVQNITYGASDFSSFWLNGINSTGVSEYNNNPYYHTEDDIVATFDLEYYGNISKMVIGVVAELANSDKHSLSIDEIDKSFAGFEVYPNPAKDIIQINNSYNTKISLELIDVTGKQWKYVKASQTDISLNISGCPAGMYLLVITTENNRFTKQILKY